MFDQEHTRLLYFTDFVHFMSIFFYFVHHGTFQGLQGFYGILIGKGPSGSISLPPWTSKTKHLIAPCQGRASSPWTYCFCSIRKFQMRCFETNQTLSSNVEASKWLCTSNTGLNWTWPLIIYVTAKTWFMWKWGCMCQGCESVSVVNK